MGMDEVKRRKRQLLESNIKKGKKMKKSDNNIEKQVDDILESIGDITKVEPSESFTENVMARFHKEVSKGRVVTMNFLPYIRIAASLIVFAVIGNLLILITSLSQPDNNDMLSEFSSEYNIDQEDQWWTNLASGTYYDFSDNN